jgi:hypothetical protein
MDHLVGVFAGIILCLIDIRLSKQIMKSKKLDLLCAGGCVAYGFRLGQTYAKITTLLLQEK